MSKLVSNFEKEYRVLGEHIQTFDCFNPRRLRIRLDDGRSLEYDDKTKDITWIDKWRSAGGGIRMFDRYEWQCLFYDRLKELMDNLGISDMELSELSNISYTAIRKYLYKESTPCLYEVYKLSHALGCHPSYLIDETEQYISSGDRFLLNEKEYTDRFSENLDGIIGGLYLIPTEIARWSGVNVSQIRSYRIGDRLPNGYTVVRLAHGIACSVSDLVDL